MKNLLNTTFTINALNIETFKKMNNLSNYDIKKIESNLYKTHFVNMMPQRGFLTSEQSLVTAIDVDLNYDIHFFVKIFKEEGHSFLFVENGPMKISPYQEKIIIEVDNSEALNFLSQYKFYILKGDFDNKNLSSTFLKSSHEFLELPIKKIINGNQIIYNFDKESTKILDENDFIIYASEDNLDPVYSYKIRIDKSGSSKIFYTEGFESIIKLIDKNFKDLNLSGNLYKTRNGLRILLKDKFRDISKEENIESILNILEIFLMDDGLLNAYKLSEKRLIKYLVRLTPKLKNYKYMDNSYQEILKNLESVDLSSLYLEKNTIPLKYDFNKITYSSNNNSEFVDYAFGLLKNMIFKYLKDDTFAVCSFIKSYDYNGENDIINKYINYHDKWTKANLKNTILI
jgi:hypothetical protein